MSDETLTPDDGDDSDDQTPAVLAALKRQRDVRLRHTMFLELIENMGITVIAHEQSARLTPDTEEPRLKVTVWGDELSSVLTQLARREAQATVRAMTRARRAREQGWGEDGLG